MGVIVECLDLMSDLIIRKKKPDSVFELGSQYL
jgi:hypothetical protein